MVKSTRGSAKANLNCLALDRTKAVEKETKEKRELLQRKLDERRKATERDTSKISKEKGN